MTNETRFGVRNAKLRGIKCGCVGRGWLLTMVFSETSKKNKLILLCATCETNWMEVDDPALNYLPEYPVSNERTEGVEGSR